MVDVVRDIQASTILSHITEMTFDDFEQYGLGMKETSAGMYLFQ
jgi:hypothetical protein